MRCFFCIVALCVQDFVNPFYPPKSSNAIISSKNPFDLLFSFNPIFNFYATYARKMLDIICDHHKIIFNS